MNQLVFTNSEEANFFNETFINLKLNSDSTNLRDLFKKYKIYGLPTTIILDSKGNEVDRIIGFDKENFVNTVKDYAKGKNTLVSCLALDEKEPNNIENIFTLAKKFSAKMDDEKSKEYYNKLIKLNPTEKPDYVKEAQYKIAYIEVKAQKNEKPLLDFIANCDDQKFLQKAYSNLIRFNQKLKNIDRVLDLYEKLLKKVPDNANLMNKYAWFIFKGKLEKSYQRGIEVAKKAVELQPEEDGIWDTLAQLYFANGETKNAISAMEKAVKLSPKSESYQKLLAQYKAS